MGSRVLVLCRVLYIVEHVTLTTTAAAAAPPLSTAAATTTTSSSSSSTYLTISKYRI